MDRLLGLNREPLTIELRYKEDRGSIQLRKENQFSLKTKNDNKVGVLPRYTCAWNNARFLQSFLTDSDRLFILVREGRMGFQDKIGFAAAAGCKRKFPSLIYRANSAC